MSRFKIVAMGGTFDIVHKGHIRLLTEAFSISSKVVIGLTGDDLAHKRGKFPVNSYQKRFENLRSVLESKFFGKDYEIHKLENDFGPAVLQGDVEALVVSQETENQGDVLNALRKERGLGPVKVIVVPMELASDGTRISTTRIKNSEIDAEGNLN